MDFLVCAYGEPDEAAFIPFIKDVIDGIEIQNYDRRGVLSESAWHQVLEEHRRLRPLLPGRLAVHGPFVGIDYTYKDHLLRDAVRKRLDMTFDMVCTLRPDTLVLHSGCPEQMVRFGLTDPWFEQAVAFWRQEIKRYEELGVRVVLENVVEPNPDLLIQLVDKVSSAYLGLCFDIGHATLCSPLPPAAWVEQMGNRLMHVHLHDNNGATDEHLPIGKGHIDIDAFFDALYRLAPNATISLEIIAAPQIVVANTLEVIRRYRS
ncbi:MAG: sugar phosphate isomerase/epimerase [Desulfobacterota bacterium]|nr:sugar phosphate isomerase/epimerase [Thermodesulfobacteriota bacterium]